MKHVLIFFVFFLPVISHGQNLVVNGSFEDTSNCGTNRCGPAGWFSLKRTIATGYNHMIDAIPAYGGSLKLCFVLGNRYDKKRSYWETILLHELQKDVRYKLTVYLHGWDEWPNLNDFGVWFTDSLIFVDVDTLLQPKQYIDILKARVKQVKGGWFRVEQEFVADRNVRCMIVGNFSPKDYQKFAWERPTNSFYIADFIDDIRVEPVVKGACTDCARIRDSIYLVAKQPPTEPKSLEAEGRPVVSRPKTVDTIELPSFLFAFDSWKMKDSGELSRYRNLMSDATIRKVIVAGYTDSVGSKEYNNDLAQKRAAEVADQLRKQCAIDPGIIETKSMGVSIKYAAMEKNRRVEIYIYR
ncbi:MAG TPA: OmpA family protein [Puia sp.]|uniref:OmpA family protein n=1 Tax=Puia sp. TaxID=2045100 RepID=UPI002BF1A98E|nr:OmpA family protein [Puia sp.]HVU93653.1 OmpA family protein [Puia sp.]